MKLDQKNLKGINEKFVKTKKKLKHSQLYEKKLMYLIYLAVEEGYPVDKLYNEKVGKLSSRVFDEMSNHHDSSLFSSCKISAIQQEEKEVKLINESRHSSQLFYSNASYEPIQYTISPKNAIKPSIVGTLDLNNLSQYKSTVKEMKNSKCLSLSCSVLKDPLIRFRK